MDVMDKLGVKRIKCLDNGFVELVDTMPRIVPDARGTADCAIVQAARVSYGDGLKTISEDNALIRYLMRHAHTTPFEMVEFKFHAKMPLFVARQWIRHRTANVNEISGRYSTLTDDFYIPSVKSCRQQSKTNKQGGDSQLDNALANDFITYIRRACADAYINYSKYVNNNVSKEQARMVLPVNIYTEWYWKIDLHNLLHFLALRCDAHAQYEIRVFANAMLELITPIVPITIAAWNDYSTHRDAIKLTRLEVEAIFTMLAGKTCVNIDTDNKREQDEWVVKAKRLGMVVN